MAEMVSVVPGLIVLYRRSRSARWQARIKIEGEWIRRSTGSADLDEARENALDIRTELRTHVKNNLPLTTTKFRAVAENAIKRMENELASRRGKVVYKDYISALRKYHIPYLGKFNINQITNERLDGFDDWRLEQMGKTEMSKSTHNTHNSALNKVFQLALDRGWMKPTDVPSFRVAGTKSNSRPTFTRAEYAKLTRSLRYWAESGFVDAKNSTNKFLVGERKPKQTTAEIRELLRDYVLILANTGIRHGTEMTNLKWKHLDWYVNEAGERFLEITVDGKTGNRQLIARHVAIRYFKRIQSRFPDLAEMSFDQLLKKRVDKHVFRLRSGEQTKQLNKNFEQYLTKMDLLYGTTSDKMPRTLYSLRHFYATRMIQQGISLAIIAKQMGTSVGMLEKFYSKFIPHMSAQTLAGERFDETVLAN
ncbi:site-specific integrase [Marinobacterium sp. xm-g-59]|jgi:integrase|uniref:tyrosine-type recombinase/integrase n=1 Tax=Marinobacterium sp. xm-g-59 TaxID=2497748 RepID=UPI00156A24BD|nr:site-specific integrase [Marinobacterium sp. xm-g-59]